MINTLLVFAAVGVGAIAALWYRALGIVVHSKRFTELTNSLKPKIRVGHTLYELLLVLLSVPLFVFPFTFVIWLPLQLSMYFGERNPIIGVGAPIVALVSLGISAR